MSVSSGYPRWKTGDPGGNSSTRVSSFRGSSFDGGGRKTGSGSSRSSYSTTTAWRGRSGPLVDVSGTMDPGIPWHDPRTPYSSLLEPGLE